MKQALETPPVPVACRPERCRGQPLCPHRHCGAHPDHDEPSEFDPVARARFWRAYLIGMALITALLVWWLDR